MGEIRMVCARQLRVLCLSFPPPLCTGVSLLLAFCTTLLVFQELEMARAKCQAPEELPVRTFLPPSGNYWSLSPAPSGLGDAYSEALRGERREGKELEQLRGKTYVWEVGSTGWLWPVWQKIGDAVESEKPLKGLEMSPDFLGDNLGAGEGIKGEPSRLAAASCGREYGERWKAHQLCVQTPGCWSWLYC